MVKDFKKLEQEIVNLRGQLRDLSQKRYTAETSGSERKTFDARIKLADSALRNCSTVTEYIRKVSGTIAKRCSPGPLWPPPHSL
jgi:hypothetical protein